MLADLAGGRPQPKGEDLEDYWEMAAALLKAGAENVVITGGHQRPPTDLLFTAEGKRIEFPGRFVYSESTHGTGCAFSSALACKLAQGQTVEESVRQAKDYVSRALISAYRIGKGTGPLNHFPPRQT